MHFFINTVSLLKCNPFKLSTYSYPKLLSSWYLFLSNSHWGPFCFTCCSFLHVQVLVLKNSPKSSCLLIWTVSMPGWAFPSGLPCCQAPESSLLREIKPGVLCSWASRQPHLPAGSAPWWKAVEPFSSGLSPRLFQEWGAQCRAP